MPEIPRTRDCYILMKGDTVTLPITQRMIVEGWRGGQGVQYVDPGAEEFKVDYSDGLYAGFLLWGSDEKEDDLTAMTRNQPAYGFAVMGTGNWIILTQSFERFTFASRQAGPLVPIDYHASDRLVFSLRGFWTKEDEWALSGDPRAPNNYFIGFVVQRPVASRRGYMTIQVSI